MKHFEKQLAETIPLIVFKECTTLVMTRWCSG
jgi:hypothetical protein